MAGEDTPCGGPKLLLFALLLCAGCAAPVGSELDEQGSVQSSRAALTDDGGDPYKAWGEVKDRFGVSAAAVDDPGVCFSASGFVTFQRDASNKFQSVTWDSSGVPEPGVTNPRASRWTTWPGPRTFNSRPACGNLDPVDSEEDKTYQILLVGRGSSDNKLYASSAQANQSPDGSEPDAPVVLTVWSKISDTIIASGPGVGVSSSKVVVVAVGSNGRVYAFHRPMPYASGGFTAVQAPALPSGWSVLGSPAIAYTMGTVNQFTVMVEATKIAMSPVFFRAHFNGTTWGSWAQHGWPTIAGGPALEYSTDVEALTLFAYQGSHAGSFAVQQTGLDVPFGSLRTIRGDKLSNVVGAPAVHGYWGTVEGEGLHRIIARVGSKLWWTETPLVVLYP